MTAVFVGKGEHLCIFLTEFAQVGVECLDVALSGVDFLVEDGDLFVVGLDELLTLLDFLVEEVDFVKGHLLIFFGLFQQLVSGGDFLLQRGYLALQLFLRLAFRLLAINRIDQGQQQQNQYDM